MPLTPDEAADTLRDIAATETHSRRAYGYREASPHLILWGVLWAIGYGSSALVPRHGGAIWSTIIAIGFVAGSATEFRAVVRRDTRAGIALTQARQHAVARAIRRFNAIAVIAALFIAAALAVVSPVTGRQIDAFIPLVVAAGYAVMGLWLGPRFMMAGAALGALTLGGFFLLPAYFGLWMAVAGSGTLLLGGLWLRRA